jgi:hypothetical protein
VRTVRPLRHIASEEPGTVATKSSSRSRADTNAPCTRIL